MVVTPEILGWFIPRSFSRLRPLGDERSVPRPTCVPQSGMNDRSIIDHHALFSQAVWYNVLQKHTLIGHVLDGLF